VPIIGSLDVGILDSTAFSLLSKSNSKIDGNQITFGYIDFQPHPTTLVPVFANLQEVDLTIGSFNFRVGSLGSARLLDPVKSGPSARDTTSMATPEASVGSSNEANSPISVKPTKGTAEELDEIMENLDLKEFSGHQDSDSARKPSFQIPIRESGRGPVHSLFLHGLLRHFLAMCDPLNWHAMARRLELQRKHMRKEEEAVAVEEQQIQ
jgi:hypothetical protein